MSFAKDLKGRLKIQEAPKVDGTWRPISLCLDDTACEFLNVGVVFSHGQGVEVRMLDNFDRLKCLYDNRIDKTQLQHLLLDIEATLEVSKGELPDTLSDSIRLGPALYAQGEDAERLVDTFFHDVVTLAKPKHNRESSQFRYRSTNKVQQALLGLMTEKLGLAASKVIQEQAFSLPLRNGKTIDVDVPLLSASAVGSVVSAWYKSPTVVENTILQAGADLSLVASHSPRQPAMSVLVPGSESGLSHKERALVERAAHRKIERFERSGITILRDDSTAGLAEKTIDWWQRHGAA